MKYRIVNMCRECPMMAWDEADTAQCMRTMEFVDCDYVPDNCPLDDIADIRAEARAEALKEAADRCEAEFIIMVANADIDHIDAIKKLRQKQVAQLRAAITQEPQP
jgi:hypothetical protein